MGLPQVNITFLRDSSLSITSQGNGIVALVYQAECSEEQINEYKALIQLGGPSKIIEATYTSDIQEALDKLQTKRWNYLVCPDTNSDSQTTVKNWIISQRANKKTFKAVLANTPASHEGIINFTTTGIKVGEDSYTTEEFTCRIAGLIAGCPSDHSVTYYPLGEVTEIQNSTDPDGDINDGKLILIDDGEKIKIARGINSLNTIIPSKTEDYKSIKIIDAMDLMLDDITDSFNNNVVGINNSYDNKCEFLTALQQYIKALVDKGVLYDGYDNRIEFDLAAIAEMLGSEAAGLTDEQMKVADTKTWIYLKANIKFQNALEDLELKIYI
jgi:hypothetical protein